MKQKLERLDKLRGKERKDHLVDDIPNFRGCPVPEPIQCSGKRLDATLDDGILMECTNVACPFKEVPIHDSCFTTYEDHLVRLMGQMGSARGWTESQRRSNLWEKKGQALVAKVGRCRCGEGTTRRNEDAFYSRQKKKHQEAQQANGGKKKKTKELPKLQYISAKNAAQPAVAVDRPSRPIVKPVKLSYRKRSPSVPSTVSHATETFTEPELIRAPIPPKQVVSYASATKREDANPVKTEFLCEDSGVEMKNDRSSSTSDFSDLIKDLSPLSSPSSNEHSPMDFSNPAKDNTAHAVTTRRSRSMWRRGCSGDDAYRSETKNIQMEERYVPVLSIFEEDDVAEPIVQSLQTPKSAPSLQYDIGSQFAYNMWSPMFGYGFNIGESLLADKYLPHNYQ